MCGDVVSWVWIKLLIVFDQCVLVVGVDEVGCGLLVGLVVVVVVIFDLVWLIVGLDDLKKFSECWCEVFYLQVIEWVLVYCVIVVEIEEIDCINIFQVIMVGMSCVVVGLFLMVYEVLVDGNVLLCDLFCVGCVIVGGDVLELVISVVLILVKVSCDCLMMQLDVEYFGYGFVVYKGYVMFVYLDVFQCLGLCL